MQLDDIKRISSNNLVKIILNDIIIIYNLERDP